MTDPPENDESEPLKIKLLTAIAEHSGSTQAELVRLAGVPANRGKNLLNQFEGQLWTAKIGPHNSRLYYPLERRDAELVFSS